MCGKQRITKRGHICLYEEIMNRTERYAWVKERASTVWGGRWGNQRVCYGHQSARNLEWPRHRLVAFTTGRDDASVTNGSENGANSAEDNKKRAYRRAVQQSWRRLVLWSRVKQDETDIVEDRLEDTINKVCIFGGGSFGTAIATLLAKKYPQAEIHIIVRNEEQCSSINNEHRNSRYLTVRKDVLPIDALLHGTDIQYSNTPFLILFLQRIRQNRQ